MMTELPFCAALRQAKLPSPWAGCEHVTDTIKGIRSSKNLADLRKLPDESSRKEKIVYRDRYRQCM
jgi:hypothetical protein